MEVTVVGSGDAFGSGGRFQTCIALSDDADGAPHTLVDCGATSLVALRRHLAGRAGDLHDVGTVVVTHLHGDHVGGLPFLVLDGQFRGRTRDLTVVGPPGTERRLDEAMEVLFPGSSTTRRRFAVRVDEHDDRVARDGERVATTPFEVRHASGAPAYAVRVHDRESDAVVAYSGDTEWTDALLDAARGTDLFLCEGYSTRPVRWHLDLDTIDRHAHRLETRRLVLTHLGPDVLARDDVGRERAHDGWAVDPSA